MNALRFVRALAACWLFAATGCMWTTVEPAPDLDLVRTKSARPALGFAYHHSDDPRLLNASFPSDWSRVFDGEDLALATQRFRKALEGAETFGAITRTKPGTGLHGEFQLRTSSEVAFGGFFISLSLGLIPDYQRAEYELVAKISAPGRETRTYRARSSSSALLWLPLLPVGVVQLLSSRGDLQQAVDSIATQMANDGWLGG